MFEGDEMLGDVFFIGVDQFAKVKQSLGAARRGRWRAMARSCCEESAGDYGVHFGGIGEFDVGARLACRGIPNNAGTPGLREGSGLPPPAQLVMVFSSMSLFNSRAVTNFLSPRLHCTGSSGLRQRMIGVVGIAGSVSIICRGVFAWSIGPDFGGRKNELSGCGVHGDFFGRSFCFMRVSGLAFGLKFAKLAQGFLQHALQALFVQTQIHEDLWVGAEDACGREGGMDLRIVDVDVSCGFEVAERESIESSMERMRFRRQWVSQKS